MNVPRVALWCMAALSFGAAVFAYRSENFPLLYTFLVLGVILPAIAEAYATYTDLRKKRDWYARNFSSLEELRGTVDESALRRLRDEKGLAVATRELRRTYPQLPLAEAAKLIKTL
ncbi:hypothetical protein RKE29_16295 [Streptomyces sp. B1866]|uniref:hypothetical protein n=1 Tax=Streptomyces sp. B1866 TaxID=3075431 RepID=UPI002891A2E4|nr:hypothetical protein [Streptomyces sp. B1866]MDT3398183.1 hypothetical protein [Streptomyces sp. B1866]